MSTSMRVRSKFLRQMKNMNERRKRRKRLGSQSQTQSQPKPKKTSEAKVQKLCRKWIRVHNGRYGVGSHELARRRMEMYKPGGWLDMKERLKIERLTHKLAARCVDWTVSQNAEDFDRTSPVPVAHFEHEKRLENHMSMGEFRTALEHTSSGGRVKLPKKAVGDVWFAYQKLVLNELNGCRAVIQEATNARLAKMLARAQLTCTELDNGDIVWSSPSPVTEPEPDPDSGESGEGESGRDTPTLSLL